MRPFAALLLTAPLLAATPAKEFLPGKRLILKGTACAGWAFVNSERALRYDEMACGPADEPTCSARIQWLEGARFLLVEERGPATPPGCPPRTWLYEVVEAGPKGVVLKEAWLGWGAGRDSRETYRLAPLPASVRAGISSVRAAQGAGRFL